MAARLTAESRRRGQPFKQVVNDLLRAGIEATRKSAPRRPFKVTTRPLGMRPGLDYDDVGALLEQLEGPTSK